MNSSKRLRTIRKILARENVASQNGLAKTLKAAGFRVSQSSLSRDLKKLGVQKVRMPDGTFTYSLPSEKPAATSSEAFRKRFSGSVTGVRRSGFVVLLFTPPGEAQLVGRLLDQLNPKGLVGNVSGDDTIICIAENNTKAKTLEKDFRKMLR
jgi:transcriptional regulator of arginine metabolism